MLALVQRVSAAQVLVGDDEVATTGPGLVVYACATRGDDEANARALATKVAGLRIFGEGKMERSVVDTGGSCLVVSQFTLAADTRKGNRPSFDNAMEARRAGWLVDLVASGIAAKGVRVATGRFGAHMRVKLDCDGPVTIWLETRKTP